MKISFAPAYFICLLVCMVLLVTTSPAIGKGFPDGPVAREKLTAQVTQLFQDGKFAQLDRMADGFRSKKARYPDGQWKLSVFYAAFDLATNMPDWVFPSYISLAEKWRKERPDSVTARCVLAGLWKDYAWKARGGGYAREVREDAWPLVRERLDKAWNIANEPLRPGVQDCPRLHYLRLILAKARGVERNKFEKLFRDAVGQSPGYYHHYVVKADYLLPKWYGKDGDWQRFITETADRNPGGEGATIYARTAWSMFQGNEWTDFRSSEVSWKTMNDGFKEIERNYPKSPWILNWHTRFACRAGDLATLRTLLGRIDTRNYYADAWGKDNIDDCRRWVKLGKTREEVGKQNLADNLKKFESKMFTDLLKMAEHGNLEVIGDLSEMYQQGRGTAPDPVAACAWLLQDEAKYKERLAQSMNGLTQKEQLQARELSAVIRQKVSRQSR